jgi:nucleoside-diphosphate-sugar epimerase
MKVLFIGGTGEISHSCVVRAVDFGCDVTVFNRGRSTAALPADVKQVTGRLENDDEYRALATERYDVVCQFLAYEMEIVQRDIEIFGGRCGQYLFISTASAYRKPPQHYVITESTPLENPFWPYSQQKAEMEAFLFEQHRAGAINLTVVRPSHTVRTKFPGGIVHGDDWAWRMLRGKPILVQGDGTSLWTLTHSDDFAAPFVRLFANEEAVGQAFHITRHMEAFAWNDIFHEMARALGVEPNLVHVPSDTLVRYNSDWKGPLFGDKMYSVLFDNSKLFDAVGEFKCQAGLREIMKSSAEHFQRRRSRYEPDHTVHSLLDRIASDVAAWRG